MAKKFFTDESLETFVDKIKSYTDSAVSGKAEKSHSHEVTDVKNLQSTLDTISSEVDDCITGLSVSGKVITYTKNNGIPNPSCCYS